MVDAAAEPPEAELRPGHLVEVNGLASESGKQLNGQKGLLCEFLEATGRWQVRIGEKLVSLKPLNLKKAELFVPTPAAPPVAPAAATEATEQSEPDRRSRSRSSSSSSSSSSRPKARDEAPLKTGEEVEIFGLSSDAGKTLNGQKGVVTEYCAEKDRWEVMISLEKVVSLRPANLRRSKPLPGAVKVRPMGKKTEGSLASLLGMGSESQSQTPAKPAEWQSVWARTSAEVRAAAPPPAAAMSEDQLSYLQCFQNENEKTELKRRKRESKIRRELVMQGITDEDMVLEVIRQREEQRRQNVLFRGEAGRMGRDSSC